MVPARFITEVGTDAYLRVYWGDTCPSGHGYHNAQVFLARSLKFADWTFGGEAEDHPLEQFPTKCDHCQEVRPEKGVNFQVFYKRRYNTASGEPEVGDLFWVEWWHHEGRCIFWDNCTTPHLVAICPNGGMWDIDSRASNCTMKDDKIHRCWIRHGGPPHVTVDKSGYTCAAGAGSIQTSNWHGFLRNGQFEE